MKYAELKSSVNEELGHLSDSDPQDQNITHTTIFKCLVNIILIFISFLKCDYFKFKKIIEILYNTYNQLITLDSKEEPANPEPEETVEVHVKGHYVPAHDVHIKGHYVPAHDEKRTVPDQSRLEEVERENRILRSANQTMIYQQEEKRKIINQKTNEVAQEKRKVRDLEEEILELKLQRSSETSTTPPSKEHRYPGNQPIYRNGRNKSHDQRMTIVPEKTGFGYKPALNDDVIPDKIIKCYPAGMSKAEIKKHQWKEGAVHNRIDIISQTEVTRYVQMKTKVKGKRGPKMIKGTFPEEARAEISYGDGVKRQVFILHSIGLVSMKRISEIMRDDFGITINPTQVNSIIKKVSLNFTRVSKKIADFLKKEAGDKDKIFQADETELSVNGQTYYDHILVCGPFVLHVIDKSRGLIGSRKSGVFDLIKGTMVSDFFKNYQNRQFENAYCWSHLERELLAAMLRDPDQEWIKLMQEFAFDSYKAYYQAREEGRPVPEEEIKILENQYDQAVKVGLKETGASRKTNNLLLRFSDYKKGILAHLYNTEIPRTNNKSEKEAAQIKHKLDVSKIFKTEKGAQDYADLLSVLSTAQHLGLNPIDAIDQTIGGNLDFLFTQKKDESVRKNRPEIMHVEKIKKDKKIMG